ncbi:hypothetical protein ACCC92_11335 [Mucilaginibacter sp. Mucisp84]|uniref:hypothetical protein n=1 Tax=Mucilaginibacter sp. Mucisp84 TaxID=3243058 RepID=UPI0039A41C09
MDLSIIPSRPGQICKIVSDIPDLESDRVYIVAEDPVDHADDDEILVVDLKELQRNIKDPDAAARESIRKDELVVISEDLENYIRSWNDR